MRKMLELSRKILAEQLNTPLERIRDDTIFSELNADHNDVLEVIRALEDVYDIEFPDDNLEFYPGLEVLVAYLYEYVQQVKA